jgi:hypothetical protein
MLTLAAAVLLAAAPSQAVPDKATPPPVLAAEKAPAPAATADAPLDFTPEAKLLFRVVACAGDAKLPETIDQKVLEAHCAKLTKRIELYQKTWVKEAEPFIQGLKPAGLPTTVVYPFGGGDLISALTTYPEAREITTMSLEHAGDPRRIHKLTSAQLKDSLAAVSSATSGLLVANDSKTENLQKVQRGDLPGQLSFFLIGLAAHGYEPVSLKYIKLNPDGSVRYLTQKELDALEGKNAQLLHKSWVSPDFSEAFDNIELTFVKKGEDPKTQARVHRHFAENLANDHFGKDEPLKKYLEARGRIVAMTKAASYLLWREDFSDIRDYLTSHMEFMVSDSTGVPPKYATKAGFVQDAYGVFQESFLAANEKINEDFRAVWKHHKPLAFRYGYIDKNFNNHMLVTRKPTADEAKALAEAKAKGDAEPGEKTAKAQEPKTPASKPSEKAPEKAAPKP